MTRHAELSDVLGYCDIAIKLHAILDDPGFDLDLRQIGTGQAEKDFAKVWLQFDERLRTSAPDPKLLSALEVIAAHARSIIDRATTPLNDLTYIESLERVLDYHTSLCLPDH
jgi:hypothetical protein